MLVLGIDPGTATTGYGLVRQTEQGELVVVEYGVITTSPDMMLSQRLLQLHQELQALITRHHPQESAVEKLFFQRNVRTAMAVSHARGVALLAMAEVNIQVAEYSPVEVKQAIVGYGGADKNQVQQMVKALLGLKDIPKPDDAADALAVAICHLHSTRISSLVNEP